MSLMNEMLRDLDHGRHRRQTHGGTAANLEVSNIELIPLSDSGILSGTSVTTWGPALVAFLVVAGLLFWQQSNSMHDSGKYADKNKSTALQAKSSSLTADDIKLAISRKKTLLTPNYYPKLLASMDSAESTHQFEPKAVVKVSSVSNSKLKISKALTLAVEPSGESLQVSIQIKQLLQAATVALSLDRLLSPVDDNAYSRYREVLVLQPDNESAKAGLRSVARRYIHLAKGYYQKGNRLRAKVLLGRAETVIPEDAAMQREIDQAKIMLSVVSPISRNGPVSTSNLRASKPTIVPAIAIKKEGISAVKLVAQSPDIKPSSVAYVKKTHSPLWYDKRASQQAKNLYAGGRTSEALALLRGVVEEMPTAEQSFDTLIHLLINSNKISETQHYLNAARHLSRSNRIEYQARILLSENRTDTALELLEAQRENVGADISYRALLAGLYNKQGRFESSVGVYQGLLREGENKTEYWLGLAIALDSLERNGAALKAFYKAQDPKQSEKVRRYIAARIQSLSS